MLYRKINNHNFIKGTQPQIIAKDIEVDYNKTRIFSPMGLGVLDIALAEYIYFDALDKNLNITIENFID